MNFLYNVGREGFLTRVTVGATVAQHDWVNDHIRVALVEDTYVGAGNEGVHRSYADIAPHVAADAALTGRTTNGSGTASASTVVFPSVPAGPTISAVVIYKSDQAGLPLVNADSPLILHLSTAVTGLPITPNGGDITVLWNGGTGEIFRI